MPVLRFEGDSDDRFGEVEFFDHQFDNCGNGQAVEYLVLGPQVDAQPQEGLVVSGQFGRHGSGWSVSVTNYDPEGVDAAMPRWPMRIEPQHYRNGFQPSLVIEAPDGVSIRCLQER